MFTLKQLVDLYDYHNGIIVINDNNLIPLYKGKTANYEKYKKYAKCTVMAFGFYDNEFCVRIDAGNERETHMTLKEVLDIIHERGIEFEVYNALYNWIVNDRAEWVNKAMEARATVKAVNKIVNGNPNAKCALEGIKSLCEDTMID